MDELYSRVSETTKQVLYPYMKDEEIRSLLTNRITSEEITLEYIVKVLNINITKKKEDIQYSVMLD